MSSSVPERSTNCFICSRPGFSSIACHVIERKTTTRRSCPETWFGSNLIICNLEILKAWRLLTIIWKGKDTQLHKHLLLKKTTTNTLQSFQLSNPQVSPNNKLYGYSKQLLQPVIGINVTCQLSTIFTLDTPVLRSRLTCATAKVKRRGSVLKTCGWGGVSMVGCPMVAIWRSKKSQWVGCWDVVVGLFGFKLRWTCWWSTWKIRVNKIVRKSICLMKMVGANDDHSIDWFLIYCWSSDRAIDIHTKWTCKPQNI